MWHDFNIKGYMKPCFRLIKQEVLGFTGVDICILMNMISKSRFLTSISEESSSKRTVEHSFHYETCFLPLLIQLLQKRLEPFTLTTDNSCMQSA